MRFAITAIVASAVCVFAAPVPGVVGTVTGEAVPELLNGVTGEYSSPALTATHIHQAAAGQSGPPRIAFANPTGEGDERTSSGCLQGPFTTGVEGDDGNDTGDGFSLAQLEADPAGFQADTHTSEFVAGAIRGQLEQVPVDGPPTGFGGTVDEGGVNVALIAGLGVVAAAGAAGGVALARRRG